MYGVNGVEIGFGENGAVKDRAVGSNQTQARVGRKAIGQSTAFMSRTGKTLRAERAERGGIGTISLMTDKKLTLFGDQRDAVRNGKSKSHGWFGADIGACSDGRPPQSGQGETTDKSARKHGRLEKGGVDGEKTSFYTRRERFCPFFL
jgi:hypothetical protein